MKWTSFPELNSILVRFGPYEATSTPFRKKGNVDKFKIHFSLGKLKKIGANQIQTDSKAC